MACEPRALAARLLEYFGLDVPAARRALAECRCGGIVCAHRRDVRRETPVFAGNPNTPAECAVEAALCALDTGPTGRQAFVRHWAREALHRFVCASGMAALGEPWATAQAILDEFAREAA